MGSLSISLTGLYAAQAGLRATEHNIANVNTVGYRRQEVTQAAASYQGVGVGFLGRGVELTELRQAYSRFLDNEVLLNQGQLSRYQVYAEYADQVDRLLSDEGGGIATGLDRFFAAVDEVVNDPASVVARQTLLSAGQGLASRFNAVDNRLRDFQSATDREVRTLVDEINQYARELVRLNAAIARQENSGTGRANDLRDQRDQVVAQINQRVNTTVVEQADGGFNLFIGSGQALVLGESVNTLAAIADPSDPERTVAALNISGGSKLVLDENLVSGGRLAGLMALRAEVLGPALDDLNQLALSLAAAVNEVHRAGYDLTGATGNNFFTDPLTAGAGNTGTGAPALTHLGLRQDIRSQYTLTNNGANYTLTRLSDGASRTGTLAQVVDLDSDGVNDVGFSIAVSGAPNPGDSWTLDLRDYARGMAVLPSTAAGIAAASVANQPGNNVQALALAALSTAALMNNGAERLVGFHAAAVSRNAVLASEADLSVSTYAAMTEQAQTARQNVSGVNLDEEAANLIRYQQAYQASARAIQIASSLFDEILAILR